MLLNIDPKNSKKSKLQTSTSTSQGGCAQASQQQHRPQWLTSSLSAARQVKLSKVSHQHPKTCPVLAVVHFQLFDEEMELFLSIPLLCRTVRVIAKPPLQSIFAYPSCVCSKHFSAFIFLCLLQIREDLASRHFACSFHLFVTHPVFKGP